MEEKKAEVMANLVQERLTVLKQQKERLEEQLTNHTATEQELPEAFADQRREKLAEIIKEIKILEDEETGSAD